MHFSAPGLERISRLNLSDPPLHIIARGIASSPLWSRIPAAKLQVRIEPPAIFFTGSFDPADIARLKALAWQTKHALRTLRYVSYSDLEADCRLLASQFEDTIGTDELRRYYFTCIPRGGLIVLGVLSYLLGLERWQLGLPPGPVDVPVVVVDDCAITGRRLHEFLTENQNNTIVFATLYSSPELRSAIAARESRVRACISARDLEMCGNNGEADQQEFRELFQSPDQSDYWHGLTEYLCFAWTEPNFVFLNPVTQQVEGYWTIFPQEVCLKNGPARIPVHVLPDTRTEFRVSEDIVAVSDDDSVTIDNTATHNRFMMRGIAAEMWNVLMDRGTREALFFSFSREYDIDETTLRHDIADFIGDLVSRGILKTAV